MSVAGLIGGVQDPRETRSALENVGVGTAGTPGDLEDLIVAIAKMAEGKPPQVAFAERDGLLPTSTDIAKATGVKENPLYQMFAMDPTGGFGKAAKGAKFMDDIIGAMVLAHGTPHMWKGNKADISKVGTGEGAQAYGHGLYFAEDPKVAKDYQHKLSASGFDGDMAMGSDIAYMHGMDKGLSGDELSDYANDVTHSFFTGQEIDEYADIHRIFRQKGLESGERGSLYEVDIPDEEIARMLDWDAPMADQPQAVRDALAGLDIQSKRVEDMTREELIDKLRYVDPNGTFTDEANILEFGAPATREELLDSARSMELQDYLDEGVAIDDATSTGKSLYKQLATTLGGGDVYSNEAQRLASERLAELGIPGIRYLDGTSRSTNIADSKLLGLQRSLGDNDKAVDEFLRTIHDTPAAKTKMREDLLKDLERRTRNVVKFGDDNITTLTRNGEPVNVLDQPRPDAPFPQYADEMMPVPDPVYDYENTVKYPSKLQARKPNPKARQDPKYKDEMFELERTLARQEGRPYTKAWLSKGPSEEADRFLAARQEAQSRIDRGEYTPVYDVDARYDAPGPEVFDRRGETLTDTLAVRPEVIAEHRAKLDPKMKDRIKTAYEHGEKMGGHDRWYAMGQLYDDFVKDFGPEAGPVKFRENFSDAMSATTGGADPKENLVTAGFVNFLRETGRPVPTAAWQMPSPVGGRFISGNVKMGDEVKSGRDIGMDEPKRHNFGRSYEGYKDTATMDEQMTTLMTEGELKAPPDRQYGLYEEPVHELAKEVGNPDVADVQGIVWGGAKDMAEKARAKEKLVNAVAKLDTPAEQAKVTALTNKQQANVDKAQARVAKEEAFAGQAKTPVQETARAKKVEAAKKSLATALARQDKAMTPAQRAADNARLANETAGHTGKPMIQIWNEMVERTSALTGRSPNEVNRLARAGKIPLYAVGGATVVGAGLGAGQGNEPGGMM